MHGLAESMLDDQCTALGHCSQLERCPSSPGESHPSAITKDLRICNPTDSQLDNHVLFSCPMPCPRPRSRPFGYNAHAWPLLQADGHPTVDEQTRTVDVPGQLGQHEDDRVGDFVRAAQLTKRDPSLLVPADRLIREVLLIHGRDDRPCRQRRRSHRICSAAHRSASLRPGPARNYSPGMMLLHLILYGPSAIAQLSIRLFTPALVGV